MKKLFLTLFTILLFLYCNISFAQTNKETPENETKSEKIKTGWNFGVLPAIAYDTDLGFKYGVLLNTFYYGDGTRYPDYYRMFKTEISNTTKNSAIFQLFYDDKALLPNDVRLTADISYLPEQAVDFYGFNGNQSVYNVNWTDVNDSLYVSRMFYRQKRKIFRFTLDFQQFIKESNFKWLAGIGIWNFNNSTIDIDKLNKNKDEDKLLPEVDLLYDIYKKWNLISEREAKGGVNAYIKAGIIYDTRDLEANPSKGMFSEAVIQFSPDFSKQKGTENFSFIRLALTHRQYFTLIPNKLTAAYRIGYQGVLSGTVPYYVQPIMLNSFSPITISEGLGGAKNIRGVLRNRIIGDHIAYGNVELRWRFVDFQFINQNFYLTFAPFIDLGTVLGKMRENQIKKAVSQLELPVEEREEEFKGYYTSDSTFVQYNKDDFFNTSSRADRLHMGYGAGLYLSMNHNFIISLNYGKALLKNDGGGSLYINLGFIF
ncbi:MAG: Omp85 family outer membrane protein [Bacteroidales bacterium]